MKKYLVLSALLCTMLNMAIAQEMQTIFKGPSSSGAYAALSNKFTTINGEYANMVELYGGWFINRKFLLGIGGAAVTNNLTVPEAHRVLPGVNMSYEYGQFGLITEYVYGSNKAVHFNVTMLTGAGFTLQYIRHHWDDWDNNADRYYDYDHDENFFFVMEPGVQLEVNIFRWMRFSPGVSYRKTFGADARGISDNDLSNVSYNLTLKFGKF